MAANVENMFFTGREKPWHGLGVSVEAAPLAEDAIVLAGLDWNVIQEDVFLEDGKKIRGVKANLRDVDRKILGVVSNRYQIVQNKEAFSFVNELLGEGVRYETAGSLNEGKRIWLLARMPEDYKILGDDVEPYFVLTNSHDGKGGIQAAMTPIRVVCQNTLNLALGSAQRQWKTTHVGNFANKVADASMTMYMGKAYMEALAAEADHLATQKITEFQLRRWVKDLFPIPEDAGEKKIKNIQYMRDSLMFRYKEAPDLQGLGNNAYRFINAVSDLAGHQAPLRDVKNSQENLFIRTIEGSGVINNAYKMIRSA